MKKVLSVIQTPTFGGPHNRVVNLAPHLKERGFETIVCLPEECESGIERMTSAGLRVLQVPIHRMRKSFSPSVHLRFVFSFASTVRKIRQLIEEEGIDVVQVCGLMGVHSAIAAKKAGVPVVWQLLGTFAPMPLRRVLVPLVNRCANVVMCTGQKTADLHPGLNQSADKLILFTPPVDLERFKQDVNSRERVRASWGVGHDEIVVGSVGNRNRAKAHEVFVEAAKLVAEVCPSVKFLIKGELSEANAKDYNHTVMTVLQESGLSESGRFFFADRDLTVPEVMNGLDVFVLSSRNEGVPTALLEAMVMGLPVVSTLVGSVREVVDDGEVGWGVASNDPRAMADRIIEMVQDEEGRKRMGVAASAKGRKEFGLEICAAKHEQAYREALQA